MNFMGISDVEVKKGLITVLNEKGRSISEMFERDKIVVGFCFDFFVVEVNGMIKTYDENCREIGRMFIRDKTFHSMLSDTFTMKNTTHIIA